MTKDELEKKVIDLEVDVKTKETAHDILQKDFDKIKREKEVLEKKVIDQAEFDKIKRDKEALEKDNLRLQKELVSMTESKDQVIRNEHQVRANFDKVNLEKETFKAEKENLIKTLNGLAELFDETFRSIQDQNKILEAIQHNFKNTETLLQFKINAFNAPPAQGEKGTKE